MAVVGSAEVVVRAITTQVKNDIQKAFQDARQSIRAEGAAAGADYMSAFKGGLNKGVGDAIRDAFTSPEASQAAAEGGSHAGDIFRSSVEDVVGNIDVGDGVGKSARRAMDDVENVVESEGRKVGDVAERQMGDAGKRGGGAFDKFLSSGFVKSTASASKAFTVMLGTSNLIGPAVGALVSAISSAVSGLFSLASAVGQAAGALAVLPGAISVGAQALGTLKLAFSGIGEAVKAGTKAANPALASTSTAARDAAQAVADAAKGLARAQEDSARRVQDARNAVAEAYNSAAQASADAARKVSDAERKLSDDEKALTQTRKDLTQAYKDGQEQLQQLAFSAEDAALGEERAGLRLEDARAKLVAAQSLPADDQGRREAELSFKEADLAYREAKDRNSDMAAQQKKASKAGVDGTDAVVSARKKVGDAEKKVADSSKSLADARRDQQKTEYDNAVSIQKAQESLRNAQMSGARAVADAQEALRKAQQRVADATKQGNTQQKAYNASLNGLSKPAQNFVKYLVSIQGQFKSLKAAAGEDLFPKLQDAIQNLITNLFPTLRTNLRDTGGLLGDVAKDASGAATSAEGLTRIDKIMKTNNDIIGIFTRKNREGKSAVGQLVTIALRLLDVIQPITKRFAIWIRSLVDLADKSTDTKKEMQGLRDFFIRAGDTAAQLGRIFGNLFKALSILSGAATPAGQGLLDAFEGATKKLDRFLKRLSDRGTLQKFFQDASTNLKGIGDLVVAVGGEFLGLGDNKGVGRLAKGLIPAVHGVGDIIDRLTTASPALGEFAGQVVTLVKRLTQSSQINTFIKTLTGVVKAVNGIMTWFGRAANRVDEFVKHFTGVSNVTGRVGKIALEAFAVHRALSLALIPISFFFRALIGGPLKVLTSFRKVTGFIGKLRTGKIFKPMKDSSDDAKSALEKQMITDEEKTGILKQLELQALRTSGALDRLKGAAAPGVNAAEQEASAAAGAAGAAGAAEEEVAGAGTPAKRSLRQRLFGGRRRDERGAANLAPFAAAGSAAGRATGDIGKTTKSLGLAGKAAGGLGLAFRGLGGGILALTGGPLGLFIILLPLLIKGFIALYKHSPQFRKFVDGVVKALQGLGKWLGQVINNVILPALDAFFGAVNTTLPRIGHFFHDLFSVISTVIGAIVGFIKKHWQAILVTIFLGPVGLVVFGIIKHFGRIKKAISGAVNFVIDFVRTHWKVILAIMTGPIGLAVLFITRHWDTIRRATNNVFNAVQDKIHDVMGRIRTAIGNAVGWVIGRWQDLRGGFSRVIGFVSGLFGNFIRNITRLRDNVGGLIGNIIDAFGGIGRGIASAFQNLGSFARSGLNAFISFINHGLVDSVNRVTSKVGFKLPHIPGLAEGGPVKGRGGARQDNVLRRVSVGEYVVQTSSVRSLGARTMDHINKTGTLPPWGSHLAAGGIVPATTGGVKTIIGEAGRAERIEPLDRNGLSARDRAMIETIREAIRNQRSGDTYNIHPSPGMSETEIAAVVLRRNNFNRRAGA